MLEVRKFNYCYITIGYSIISKSLKTNNSLKLYKTNLYLSYMKFF